MSSRYVVGIDLGTTNSAVAYVDTEAAEPRIESMAIAQLVEAGEVAERPTLPSFLYLAGEHDVRPGDLALPWRDDQDFAVGELAREQGARVSGRLVSSAKSWLCHGGVDRQADILPWGAPEDVRKISPVEASSRFLQHLRAAWQTRFPDDPLDDQDVVLTVPASFDEVARELTIEAAARAELHHARLLEEPQAAFYAWLEAHPDSWRDRLAGHRLALVVDVGGGTSDFSLIRVAEEDGAIALQRLAVGDHILLGGDNVDVALARTLEERFGEKLDSQRWHALTSLCRAAKERLLGDEAPEEETIRIGGRGRSLVGGTLSGTLTREEVQKLVIDGFFPLVEANGATASRAARRAAGVGTSLRGRGRAHPTSGGVLAPPRRRPDPRQRRNARHTGRGAVQRRRPEAAGDPGAAGATARATGPAATPPRYSTAAASTSRCRAARRTTDWCGADSAFASAAAARAPSTSVSPARTPPRRRTRAVDTACSA